MNPWVRKRWINIMRNIVICIFLILLYKWVNNNYLINNTIIIVDDNWPHLLKILIKLYNISILGLGPFHHYYYYYIFETPCLSTNVRMRLPVDALVVTKKRGCGNGRWRYSCLRDTWWSSDTKNEARFASVTPCSLARVKAGRIRCEEERDEPMGCPHRYAPSTGDGYAPRWYGVKSFCQRSVESLGWSTRDRGRLRPLRIFEPTTSAFSLFILRHPSCSMPGWILFSVSTREIQLRIKLLMPEIQVWFTLL